MPQAGGFFTRLFDRNLIHRMQSCILFFAFAQTLALIAMFLNARGGTGAVTGMDLAWTASLGLAIATAAQSERARGLGGFFALAGLVILASLFSIGAAWVGGIAAVVAGLSLARSFRALSVRDGLIFGGAGLVAGIWSASVAWGGNGFDPNFETSVLHGRIFPDRAFMMSISNLLKTFSEPVLGSHGIVPSKYHWGSHWISARLSELSGTHVADFYNVLWPILVFPLLFQGVFSVALRYAESREGARAQKEFSAWTPWIVVVAIIGIVPQALGPRFMLLPTAFESESYSLSLVFFLWIISWVMSMRDTQPAQWSWKHTLGIAATGFLLTGALGVTKVSTMLLLLPVAFFVLWRKKLPLGKLALTGAILGLAGCLVLAFCLPNADVPLVGVKLAKENSSLFDSIVPFSFLRYTVGHPPLLKPLFFPLNYFWAILFVAACYWLRPQQESPSRRKSFWTNAPIAVQGIGLLCVVGQLPGELFRISGGSEIYFYDPQRFIAAAFLAGLASTAEFKKRFRLSGTRVALLLVLMLSAYLNLRHGWGGYWSAIHQAQASAAAPSPVSRKALWDQLRELDRAPREVKRNTLLYLPRELETYWNQFYCLWVPLYGSAVTGFAFLDGAPLSSCKEAPTHFQYWDFDLKAQGRFPRGTPDSVLCSATRKLGFSRLYHFGEFDQTHTFRTIECKDDVT